MRETNFKHTDIGYIPHDWEEKYIFDVASIFGRIGFRGYTMQDLVSEEQGAITLSPTNIRMGVMSYDKCTYISWKKYWESPEIMVQEGDILMVKTGSTFGKSAYVENLPCEATINPQFVVLKKIKCQRRLLAYQIAQPYFQSQIASITSGGAIPTMSQSKILKCKVILPKDADEQNRIATALMDMDELIQDLQKLITKKQNIKSGTMQLLLSGKKRLSGFNKPWEEVELKEILDYEQPTNYLVSSTNYAEEGIPVLTAGKTYILGYTNETWGVYKNVPTIIFDDFVTESKYITFPFKVKSSAIKMLKLKNDEHDLKFIYEQMQTIKFYSPEHKRYWISAYSKIKILVPDIDEQRAIAKVLTDMDDEIQMLQTRLQKYINLKQGMMQQLLTGKIRLI